MFCENIQQNVLKMIEKHANYTIVFFAIHNKNKNKNENKNKNKNENKNENKNKNKNEINKDPLLI